MDRVGTAQRGRERFTVSFRIGQNYRKQLEAGARNPA